jgi:hypothetical protein
MIDLPLKVSYQDSKDDYAYKDSQRQQSVGMHLHHCLPRENIVGFGSALVAFFSEINTFLTKESLPEVK